VAASSLTQIAPLIINVTKASRAAEQLFKTIGRVSEIDSLSEKGLALAIGNGDIEVKDLPFAYLERLDAKILNDLSLKILANKTTALVRASGSGKSTIVGLLKRGYDPAQGVLTIGGIDICDFKFAMASYSGSISAAGRPAYFIYNVRMLTFSYRNPVLFHGIVAQNVLYDLLGTSQESWSKKRVKCHMPTSS
jgi:ATP-binding cassette subfamily B (MDR/TAP) protein 1